MTTGENIKKIRKEKGLTQKKLGELSGISEPNIRKYENGKQNPKIETINKIANALGVDITDIDCRFETKKGTGVTWSENAKEYIPYSGNYIDLTDKAKLIDTYDNLNSLGKKEALKRIEELTEIERYVKEEPDEQIDLKDSSSKEHLTLMAAHNDHADDPKELEKIYEDIERLKSFRKNPE